VTELSDQIEWCVADAPVPYPEAVAAMEERAAAIIEGRARELIWLLEHPPVYTAGTSADPSDLIDPRFPVFKTGRGGKYTYHGPGQRIGYVLLDLNKRGRDVRCYVHALEGWVIAALSRIGIAAHRAEGRIGIWTRDSDGGEAKIGAIGVRIRRSTPPAPARPRAICSMPGSRWSRRGAAGATLITAPASGSATFC
jgi:lipoyl(octanoyl) transferase